MFTHENKLFGKWGRRRGRGGWLWPVLAALALARPAAAQQPPVPNDDIERRRLLQAEETVTSSTAGCTVQWACVDERLTGPCIEYHNDQWFEFRPPADGTWYVNVGGQRCRDVRGVQLVALLGTPCQPATYLVLACASLGTQDDLYVPLPGLKAGQPVLLCVDGYLKDYCSFTLQASRRARGLPVQPPPAAPVALLPGGSRLVTLTWTLPDSPPATQQMRVLRREQHQFRSQERHREPVGRLSLGAGPARYTLTDTLPRPGTYLYQVVAESDDPAQPPVLLRQQWMSYSALRPVRPGELGAGDVGFLDLPLARYPRGAYLRIGISDPATGNLLRHLALTIGEPGQAQKSRLYAQPWLDAGLRQVEVSIECVPPRGAATRERLLLPLTIPAY